MALVPAGRPRGGHKEAARKLQGYDGASAIAGTFAIADTPAIADTLAGLPYEVLRTAFEERRYEDLTHHWADVWRIQLDRLIATVRRKLVRKGLTAASGK